MNDKIEEYKEKINWNVWSDITSIPLIKGGYNMKNKPNWATGPLPFPEIKCYGGLAKEKDHKDVMDTSGSDGWEDEGGSYVIPEKDKIIKVNTKTVKCDNDHPAVWYSLTETGFAVCGYCNIKYVLWET